MATAGALCSGFFFVSHYRTLVLQELFTAILRVNRSAWACGFMTHNLWKRLGLMTDQHDLDSPCTQAESCRQKVSFSRN